MKIVEKGEYHPTLKQKSTSSQWCRAGLVRR